MQLLPDTEFSLGETKQIEVHNQSDRDGFIFIWDINSKGETSYIYPNPYTEKVIKLKAGQKFNIPRNTGARFTLTIVEPVGKSALVALLVEESLSQKVLPEQLKTLGSATNAQTALHQLQEHLRAKLGPNGWSIATVDYQVSN